MTERPGHTHCRARGDSCAAKAFAEERGLPSSAAQAMQEGWEPSLDLLCEHRDSLQHPPHSAASA